MTLFQIIMVALMGVGFAAVLGFSIAFVVEATRTNKPAKAPKQKITEAEVEEEEEYDIRQMLARLEETSEEEPAAQEVVEEEEEVVPVATVNIVNAQPEEEPAAQEEVKEEPVVEPVVEVVKQKPAEEEIVEDEEAEEPAAEETTKTIIIEKVTTETVGTDFDYNVRLAKIVESKNKMEKDLQKTKRAIMKYERTERRRARNQKMLDRRAVELTNLNLLMYSVTDIKNVDADKKAKQEELTTHIAELKASIQDADAFLAKNKERYEHDKKMFAFYTKEEARYNDEIKELEVLIKNANSVTGSVTTTTTTETEE